MQSEPAHNYPAAPDLLHQDFHVEAPNKVRVTDITYIRTDEGWLYLAVVKDLFDRQIVGFATGSLTNVFGKFLLYANKYSIFTISGYYDTNGKIKALCQ